MSTRNANNLGPVPQFEERGRQVVEVQLARNTQREGTRQAEEGLGNETDYRNAFGQGVVSSRVRRGDVTERPTQTVEIQVAGHANGRTPIASGAYDRASFRAVDDAMKAGMVQGTSDDAAGRATPFPWEPREAGVNYGHISPLHAMNGGESQNTSYQSKIASNPRTRRSPADVSDL
jgi:hypothetical protein